MKRVLSVQDLSCLGKCSLTVALPVLSAMGCSATALPTTLLSTHTAFPNPHRISLTDALDPICSHWQAIGADFETVSVGYLANAGQVSAVERVLDAFGSRVVIDPVMGDHGKLYKSLDKSHIAAMQALCRRGHILLPNVTEAALLTGIPYRQTTDPGYYRELLTGMEAFGAEAVIITGATLAEDTLGYVAREKGRDVSYQASKLPRQCHGTGDLFAAVVAGGITLGMDTEKAATVAARFVEQVLQNTRESTPFGVEFEGCLPWLWSQIH